MSNPKAPRVKRTVVSTSQSDLDTALSRLRQVGATLDEIALFRENWDRLDEEWTAERRHTFTHASDATLRQALDRVRAEYPFEPARVDEPFDLAPNGVVSGVLDDGPPPQGDEPPIGRPVAGVVAWVGDDKDRAQRVIAAELADAAARKEQPRSTLIEKMERVAGA